MLRQFGPSKGNRRPAVPKPGAKPSERPTPQKGGGGNKGAQGSPVVTAATAPTVITKPNGYFTTKNIPSSGAQAAAYRRQQRSEQRVKRIVHSLLSDSQKPAQRQAVKAPPKVAKYAPPKISVPRPAATKKVAKAPEFTPVAGKGATIPKAPPAAPVVGAKSQAKKVPAPEFKPIDSQAHDLKGTPQERKAARQKLRKAKRVVARTAGPPQIEGIDNKDQREFAEYLSKFSKIPPKLAGEWAKQEGGGWGSEGVSGGEAGEQNWLGVGYPAHKTSFSESPYFNNTTPKKAAKATAKWIEGKIGSEYDYHAADSITGISKLAKSGASEEEIRRYIEGPSAWGTGTIAQSGITVTSKGGSNPKAVKTLKQAKRAARDLGMKVGNQGAGPAPKQVVTRFKAIKKAAAALTSRHIPYVWGGGHGGIESDPQGLDCSGAVSWVLAKAGVLKTPLTSGSMGEVLKPGPGAVTVFYNAEHTFMKIGNEYWGTSVGDSGAGGLGPHPAPSAAYLAQYNVGHVPGLGAKQALQLGIKPGEVTSFPGMTLSSSGTTATINEGAGATEAKPGFSSKPIQLTQQQRARQTIKSLGEMGVTFSGSEKPKEATKGVTLSALEKKYGRAAV